MLGEVTDEQLVRAIGRRDAGALAAERELCRRFAPRIRLYGLKHLRDDERARDLVQTVLVSVLEAVRAQRLEDPARLDRFVLGTCRNVCSRVRLETKRIEPRDPHDLDAGAFEIDVERIDAGVLFDCIARLDERSRGVVYLTYNEERSADEIAAALATTAGNVRVVRHRALAQLRECLDAKKEARTP